MLSVRTFILFAGCIAGPILAAPIATTSPDSTKKELVVPLPIFAPRASAAAIVCSSSSSVVLQGKNEGASGNSLATAAIVASISGEMARESKQSMRIRFSTGAIKVALASSEGPPLAWGPDFDYTVQSDAPEDFIAIRKGSGEIGMLLSLVLNRVTGTMIQTLAIASLPSGAHPMVVSTFYVCQPDKAP